jgi:hypothetical protein
MLINDKKKLRPDGKGAGTRAQRQEGELDTRKRAKVAIAKMDKSRARRRRYFVPRFEITSESPAEVRRLDEVEVAVIRIVI